MATNKDHCVYINGRFFGQRITGVQRYARESIASLDKILNEGNESSARWKILVPQGTQVPTFKSLKVEQVGRFKGHIWEQIDLPLRVRSGLLFSFGFTGPIVKRRQIITIHDAAIVRAADTFKAHFRYGYRWLIRIIAARAPATMTVSHFSANEAVDCFGVSRDRLRITTEGWQHLEEIQSDQSILVENGLLQRPFALAVSSPTPAKNFGVIARAIESLGGNAPLCVVVGTADSRVFRSTGKNTSGLTHVGYVSDAQLKALYEHATCFIFPSFYEGFGIPALEAMALGCPVIASTAEALREVCSDAALYFSPDDPSHLAKQLRELFSNPTLRDSLRRRGLVQCRRYSWDRSAQINLSAIEEIISQC